MAKRAKVTPRTRSQQKIYDNQQRNKKRNRNTNGRNKTTVRKDASTDLKPRRNKRLCSNANRSFKCGKCTLSFDRASQLDYHNRSVHLREKSQICQICGKGFFRKTDLRTHLNIHLGTNQCICEVCGRKFNHVSNLIRHCRVHAGIKPYPCPTCGRRFTQMSSLARHKHVHDRYDEKFVKGAAPDPQKDTKRLHSCKICGEGFCFALLLQEHEKSHLSSTGLLECKSCKKNFETAQDIKDHRCQFIYTDESKIVKTQCEKDTIIIQADTNTSNVNQKFDLYSIEPIKEVNSLETVIYVTAEQFDKLNLGQKGDVANFLQQHLSMTEGKVGSVDTLLQKNIVSNPTQLLPTYNCEQVSVSVPDSNLNAYEENNKSNKTIKLDTPYVQNISNCNLLTQRLPNQCNLEQYTQNAGNVNVNIFPCNGSIMPVEQKTGCTQIIGEPALKKGKYNKYLDVDGNELYIEVPGQDISQFSQLQSTADVNTVGNAKTHDEFYFLGEQNQNIQLESTVRNNENGGCAYCDEHLNNPCGKTHAPVNREEPSLRLVQTETGEQFYELIISNLPEKNSGCPGASNCGNTIDEVSKMSDSFKVVNARTKDFVIKNSNKDVKDEDGQAEFVVTDITNIPSEMNYVQYVLQENDKMFSLPHNEREPISCSNLNQQPDFERYAGTNFEVLERSHYDNSNEKFLEFVVTPENNEPYVIYTNDDVQNVIFVNKSADNVLDGKQCNENVSTFGKEKSNYIVSGSSENNIQSITYVNGNLVGNAGNAENSNARANFEVDYAIGEHATKAPQEPKKPKVLTKKFLCSVCKKAFSTSYNYKQHIGTHFTDQQKFRCKECGVSFAWKSTLNKHVANNHRPDGPQKFVCEICPKVYSTLSQVNEHVKRDHLKERNHVCPHCGKSFFKKFDLKTHSRTHTNERPYTCRTCGKRFHHQSHTIRHERTHSGERPYACNICQKTFTQPGSLKVHKQKHDGLNSDILDCPIDEDDPVASLTS